MLLINLRRTLEFNVAQNVDFVPNPLNWKCSRSQCEQEEQLQQEKPVS